MRKLLAAIRVISDVFTMSHFIEFKSGRGPYACIDEEDGTSWNMYHGSGGVKYTYGLLPPY